MIDTFYDLYIDVVKIVFDNCFDSKSVYSRVAEGER